MATSGRIFDGARSLSRAISSRTCQSSATYASPRRVRTRWMPEVRRHGSARGSVGVPAPAASAANSSAAHSSLPAATSCSARMSSQLDQQLHVQGGVGEPVGRQRTGRPVRGGVLLQQPDVEQLLEHGAEGDPGVVEQSGGELGVEESGRGHADLEQAGQVLARRVDDPLGVGDRRASSARASGAVEGGRVDQVGARARPTQLQQVGTLGVPKAVRSLGVDRQRSGAGTERSDGGVDLLGWWTRPRESRRPVRPAAVRSTPAPETPVRLGRRLIRPLRLGCRSPSPWASIRALARVSTGGNGDHPGRQRGQTRRRTQ